MNGIRFQASSRLHHCICSRSMSLAKIGRDLARPRMNDNVPAVIPGELRLATLRLRLSRLAVLQADRAGGFILLTVGVVGRVAMAQRPVTLADIVRGT